MSKATKAAKQVAILTDRLSDRGGGTERYVMELIQVLLRHRHKVLVYTAKVDLDDAVLKHERLRIVCRSFSYCPRKLRYPLFLRFLRKHFHPRNFDAVIGINTPYSPHISICCGTWLGSMLANRHQLFNPLNWPRVYFERKKYLGCQWLLARSPMQKRELSRLFKAPEERIHVLPPPIMHPFKPKDKHSRLHYRRKHGLDDRRWNFLFPSTGHHRKGLGLIIKALNQLANADCRVVVAGSAPGFYRSAYARYCGYVKEMEELYHACDASLLFSNYEPFGRVVPESLLCATPVFLSDRVGARYLVSEAGMGRVLPAGEAVRLASALTDFMANPAPFPLHHLDELRRHVSWDSHIRLLLSLPWRAS